MHHYPHIHYPHVRPFPWKPHFHTLDSLRFRDYRLIWVATSCSAMGFWLQQVLVGWISYDLTRSALLTSLALGLDALPMLIAGPLGGVLVDSWDRRKLLAVCFGYQALLTLTLFLIATISQVQTWHIFAFILLIGASWAITDPARFSLIPGVVPREQLVNAFALNSLAFSFTRLVAPPIGGVLLAAAGPAPALLLEAGVQLAAMGAALKVGPVARGSGQVSVGHSLGKVTAAVRYIVGEPAILGLLLLAAVPSMLVMPFVHGLMPVYAAEVFHVGPAGLGLLLAAIGAGATIGTVLLASFGDIKKQGPWLVLSSVMMVAAMAAFSRNHWLPLALPNLLLLSGGTMMFFAINNAAMQSMVKSEFRGRVAGLYMVTWGISPAGSLMAGTLADRFGAPLTTLTAAGAVALGLTGLAVKFRLRSPGGGL